MKILQKSIATLLLICLMFGLVPADIFVHVSAAGGQTLGNSSGSIGSTGWTTNANGGTWGNKAGIIVPLFRFTLFTNNPSLYLDGTSEARNKVIEYCSYQYPTSFNIASNTLIFWNPEVYDTIGEHKEVAKFTPSAGDLYSYGDDVHRNLNIRLNAVSNNKPTNEFLNSVIKEYKAKKINSIVDLSEGKWKDFLPSLAHSKNTLGYILKAVNLSTAQTTYDIDGRIRAYMCNNIPEEKIERPTLLTEEEKFQLSAGYAGLLIDLYQVAKESTGANSAVTKLYDESISRYFSCINRESAPITLMIDTAVPMIVGPYIPSKKVAVPSIDFLQYSIAARAEYNITDNDTFIKKQEHLWRKGDTHGMLWDVAGASVKKFPLSVSYARDTKNPKVYRISDLDFQGTGGSGSRILSDTAYGHAIAVPQSGKGMLFTNPAFTTGTTKIGTFLSVLKIPGTELEGFMMVGYQPSNTPPTMKYRVDNTNQSLVVDYCTKKVSKPLPPKIKLEFTGGMSFNSSLLSRDKDADFLGVKLANAVVIRTTTKNGVMQGTPVRLSNAEKVLNTTLKGETLRSKLNGGVFEIDDIDAVGMDYTPDIIGSNTYTHTYDISFDVIIDGTTFKFKDVNLKGGLNSVNPHICTIQVPSYSSLTEFPKDIEITKPKSKDTTEINHPSENEVESVMIHPYEFTSAGEEFAEIKHNKPTDEKYEVMAGVPSTEELYYSVGGSEFKVAMIMQYWMNEHSRDRTYTVHFDGEKCEYNNELEGKGDRMPLKHPVAQPGDVGKYTDQDIHCSNETGTGGFDGTIVAEWKGRSKCEKIKTSCTVCGGADINRNHILDTSDYDRALVAANKLVADLGGEIVTWTSASDLTKRDEKWDGSVTTNTYANGDFTSAGSDGGKGCGEGHGKCGTHCSGHGKDGKTDGCGNACTQGAAHNPGSPCSGAHDWCIVVTAKIPNHAVCGPCCGHEMPGIYDTWRQGLVYDFVKISQIRLYKLDQGLAEGMEEVTGTSDIFASITSGNPTYFMNIAQLTEKNHVRTQNASKPILPTSAFEPGGMTKDNLEKMKHTYFGGGTTKLGGGTVKIGVEGIRAAAQSSRAGRLRYTLDPAYKGKTETIQYTYGNSQNGSYTFKYDSISAPMQHDDVIYEAGKRTPNCDGMATSGNFGKSSSDNAKPSTTVGHVNKWADGILYTNLLKNEEVSENYWSTGVTYTPKILSENDENVSKYHEDYNHHVVRDSSAVKTGYSDKADKKDALTAEWKFINCARRTPVIANVISDFLILQTSGGDQTLFYYEKESPATEAQEHFQKVKITEEEIFTNNVTSAFTKISCGAGGTYKYGADGNFADFILVGGYNGRYDMFGTTNQAKKYEPYSLVTNKTYNVNTDTGYAGTVYDATKKTGNYSIYGGSQIHTIFDNDPAKTISRPARNGALKITQTGIQIIPTLSNKLYSFKNSKVFYKNEFAYFSTDLDRKTVEGVPVGLKSNVGLGWVNPSSTVGQVNETEDNYNRTHFGTSLGLSYETKYFKLPSGDENTGVVNDVMIYTPVSTEDAIVLKQDDLNIAGTSISRDQRVNGFEFANMNEEVNKLKICPLDPSLCEFRKLDCKFVHDTVLGDFDFSPEYTAKEQVLVNGAAVTQDVVKKNTYQDAGKWVTTNKITGVEYTLPTGFTVESGSKVGTGAYLHANGARWSIPFSDLGLSTMKTNVVEVDMNLTVESNASNLMLVSFYDYGFLLNTRGKFGTFITRSVLDKAAIGAASRLSVMPTYNNVNLKISFGFNNIVDCKATVNGVPSNVVVSELRNVWVTEGAKRKLQLKRVELKDITKETPTNIKTEDLGGSVNIGGWGSDNAYQSSYYIDNLKIILKGGTLDHNSTCYEKIVVHQTQKVHTHTADCYAKEDIYTCGGKLNDNYQLGCNKTNVVEHCVDDRVLYVYTHASGCSYANKTHYTLNRTQCSCDHPSCSATSTERPTVTLPFGSCVWFHGYGHNTDMHISTTTNVCSVCKSSAGNVVIDPITSGNHTHNTECYHKHTGTPGLSYPNGCYTVPTVHTHNKLEKTLICGVPEGGEGQVRNYSYTGGMQSVTLPSGRYKLETWGAEGGYGCAYYPNTPYGTFDIGGLGGYSAGDYLLNSAQTLYIFVGGKGSDGRTPYAQGDESGGYNGGGSGNLGGGGGGATDIRIGGTGLGNRIIVAGGGGGASIDATNRQYGGIGGGLVGGSGGSGGAGGSQVLGPSLGYGSTGTGDNAGGGGGGYYGGYGGTSSGDCGGGGGSGYIGGVTRGNTQAGANSGNGKVKITNLDHVHTDSCFKTTQTECSKIPEKTLVCTGELNTDTDLNTHIHNTTCLKTYSDFEPTSYQFKGEVQTYIVPYTMDYSIEAYGAESNYFTGYTKGTVHLKKGTILYISTGEKGGKNFNNGVTDIRLTPVIQETNAELQEEFVKNSEASRLFIAGHSKDVSSIQDVNQTVVFARTISTLAVTGSGRVIITPQNNNVHPTVLENILAGNMTEEETEKYLGPELTDLIINNAQVLKTWSNWSPTNKQGFSNSVDSNDVMFVDGNIISNIKLGGYEFHVPVRIGAKTLRRVVITLDNNTAATSVSVGANGNDATGVFATMLPYTANQEISINVSKKWWNIDINSISFDTSSGTNLGTTVVKKIELVGHGTASNPGSDLSRRNLLTLSNFSSTNKNGFVDWHNTDISSVGNNLRVTSKGWDPITFWSTLTSMSTSAVETIKLVFTNNSSLATAGQLFYSGPSVGDYSEPNSFSWNVGPSSVGRQTVYIDTVRHVSYNATTKVFSNYGSGWTGNITGMRFDWTTLNNGSLDVSEISFIGSGNTVGTGEKTLIETVLAPIGTSWEYNYTGDSQSVTLQSGEYRLEVWGAAGGGSYSNGSWKGGIGLGGYSIGDLLLGTSTVANIYIGGVGTNANLRGENATGGWNGGGTAPGDNDNDKDDGGGGGGGGTDIRIGGTSLSNRIIVAGGGGGNGFDTGYTGYSGTGFGGGLLGGVGGTGAGEGALPGTQNSGFASGLGGNGGNHSGGVSGGGGGGYNGGFGGVAGNCGAQGAGGSGYVGGVTNSTTTAGINSGNGRAVITALTAIVQKEERVSNVTITSSPIRTTFFTATYRNPLQNATAEKTIMDNLDKIPNFIEGEHNPIWLCHFKDFNAHVCESIDANGNVEQLCKTYSIFNCDEPHHRGQHYGQDNKICWSACGDDNKHKNTKTEVKLPGNNGEVIHLANFLQLDSAFTVYFPNRGNFDSGAAKKIGLAYPQQVLGLGYTDGMDTTQWTREKRVKFGFDVIYEDKIYVCGTWVDLPVTEEYFNFYIPVTNSEASNAAVEFEVEAINCSTGDLSLSELGYTSAIETEYSNAVNSFVHDYLPNLFTFTQLGYVVGFAQKNNNAPSRANYGTLGLENFVLDKQTKAESSLRAAMAVVNKAIENSFEGNRSNSDSIIWPHTGSTTGVNEGAKDWSSNDNSMSFDNHRITVTHEALHGGYKKFYLDLLGRIGNFTIADTEDFRFSNFFKTPIVSANNIEALKDVNNWLVEGLVLKVDDSLQNFYIGDMYDIRGNAVSPSTRWLDTYGSQSWLTGQLTADKTGRDINNPNLVSQILTGAVNNIPILQKEELRFGYDIFPSIVTSGSYMTGQLQVIPKYYALKLTDKDLSNLPPKYNVAKGTYVPLDVYINKDGIFSIINGYDNANNGNGNIQNKDLYEYVYNLDWTSESNRRNYTLDEQAKTQAVKEYLRVAIRENSLDPNVPGEIKGFSDIDIPFGKNNVIGNAQYVLLDGKHRTFIGSPNSFGNNVYTSPAGRTDFGTNKNKNDRLLDIDFTKSVQRWHWKAGIPSSAIFVPTGLTPSVSNAAYVMGDDFAVICTMEVISIGNTWSLAYSQPWFKQLTINGQNYSASTHYPGHRVIVNGKSVPCPDCLPPIIAVYSSNASSVHDVEVVNSH